MEELKALVNTLHSRGIRERALQKQLQKSMELIAQTCNKNRDGELNHCEITQCACVLSDRFSHGNSSSRPEIVYL